MPENNNAGSTEIVGSPDLNKIDPAKAGESNQVNQVTDERLVKQNEELEKKLGEQGRELGEIRDFLGSITPFLEKVEGQPDLIKAILDDKISQDLVNAALDGKVSVNDAKEVSEAHDKVKKNMGKEYEGASAEEVESKIKAELDKQSEVFEKKLAETEELRDFKQSVQQFIDNTPDFAEHSGEITKFLDANPNIDDISIAYEVVRGRAFAKAQKEFEEKNAAQKSKDFAANAGGGSGQGGTLVDDKNVVDMLISGKSNPNNM
jgi:hypothetical protein